MTESTIFEDYKTHQTLLTTTELFDANSPTKFINIGGTSYLIIGWNDVYTDTTKTRYVRVSTEEFQGGLGVLDATR